MTAPDRTRRRLAMLVSTCAAALVATFGAALPAAAAGSVTLSGVVRDAGGSPVAGATVTFSGLSTTTAADGSYSLQPAPGSTSVLVVAADFGSPPAPPGASISGTSNSFTVSADTALDAQLPAVASLHVHVADQSASPLAGADVEANDPSADPNETIHTPGSLSDGTPVDWGWQNTFALAGFDSCTTDGSGACDLWGLDGWSVPVRTSYTAPDGNPSPDPVTTPATFAGLSSDLDVQVTVPDTTGLVTLSGVVQDAGGSPVAGAAVAFSSSRNITAADGSYALHVAPGTVSSLSISTPFGVPPAPPDGNPSLSGQSDQLTVSADAVLDAQLPPIVTLHATVTDGTGAPMVGASVATFDSSDPSGTKPIPATGALSDGTPVAWGWSGTGADTGTDRCSTDASGGCDLWGLDGWSPSVVVSYTAPAGYPDPDTLTLPVTFAGPSSTLAASFSNYATVASNGSAPGNVVLGSTPGTTVAAASSTTTAASTLPSGAVVLTGELDYQVTGVAPGGAVDVAFHPPPGNGPLTIAQLRNGTYTDLSSHATYASGGVTLHSTDGGAGDTDGSANGTLTESVVIARAVAPTAPRTPAATPGNAQAVVSWVAPARNGGRAVDAYRVTPILNGSARPTQQFTAFVTSHTITGLPNGATFTFRVQAHSVAGWGPASATSAAIVVGAPLAPKNVTATPGTRRATVQWTAPASNGKPIDSYRVTPSRNGVAQPTITYASAATSHTITGLTSGASYTFVVRAHNANGWGPPSPASAAITVG